jgi:hypothetical protein
MNSERILAFLLLLLVILLYYILISNKNCNKCSVCPPCKPCNCKKDDDRYNEIDEDEVDGEDVEIEDKIAKTKYGDDDENDDEYIEGLEKCNAVDDFETKCDGGRDGCEYCYDAPTLDDRTKTSYRCGFDLAGLVLKQLKKYSCLTPRMKNLIRDNKARIAKSVQHLLISSVDELLNILTIFDKSSSVIDPFHGNAKKHYEIVKEDYRYLHNFLLKNRYMIEYAEETNQSLISSKLSMRINNLDSRLKDLAIDSVLEPDPPEPFSDNSLDMFNNV